MSDASNPMNTMPTSDLTPGKEIMKIFELLVGKDGTIGEKLEKLDDNEGVFKRLGYIGAKLWFSKPQNIDQMAHVLNLLENQMEHNIETAPIEVNEEDQTGWFVDFEEEDIFDLGHLFAFVKVHNQGAVFMESIFHVQNMQYNMRQIVEGMKEFIKQSLNK